MSRFISSFSTLIAVLFYCCYSLATPPEGSKVGVETRRLSIRISGDNPRDVRRLVDSRESLIDWSVEVLRLSPMGKDEPSERHVRAAYLLGTLRASDSQAGIAALVQNLSMRPLEGNRKLDELDGYVAAEAIVAIGSKAIPDLLQFAQGERTQEELRLVALIIKRIEGAELAQCRIDIELRHRLKTWPNVPTDSDAGARNLRLIKKHLDEIGLR